MLEVCIVGFGAVGGIYGYLLERSHRARVTAVCRSNYHVVQERGVDIRSEMLESCDMWKPYRAVKTTGEAADREYDFVVCCAKFVPDLIPTSRLLGPLVHRASTFVLIQNGLGIHSELQRAAHGATVISACAWIDATAINEGKVIQHGQIERLVLGIHWPTDVELSSDIRIPSQTRLELLVDVLRAGGSEARATDHIDAERWRKNLWNIGYSVMCTLARASVATALSDRCIATTAPVVHGFMEEAVAIARAAGIPPALLPDSAIEETTTMTLRMYAETFPPRTEVPFTRVHFKPSMLVDLEAGRAMEVEGIVGAVYRHARHFGVPAPRLETAYASLLLLQEPLLQAVQIKAAA